MLSKNKRICPCCGKKLNLIAPNRELLPNRFGISENGIPFYLISGIRYFPYTISPESVSEFNPSVLYKCGKIGEDWICTHHAMSASCSRTKVGLNLITIPRTKRMLDKDVLFSQGGWAMAFFCENCKAKLALNYNPLTLWGGNGFLFAFLAFGYIACLMYKINPIVSVILGCVPIFLFAIISLFSLLSYLYIKLFMSNFVITNIRDKMLIPSSELELSRKSLKQRYLHKSNVFNTEIRGENFCLYLTDNGKSRVKMHICGIDGEQKRMLQLIDNEMAMNGKAMLPLSFEGKYVGNAEIIVANEVVNSPPLIYRQPLGDNESEDQH